MDRLQNQEPTEERPFYVGRAELTDTRRFPHLHQGLELGTATHGSGYLILNQKHYELRAGDSFFFLGIHPHYHIPAQGSRFRFTYAHIMTRSIITYPPPRHELRLLQPFLEVPVRLSPILCGNPAVAKSLQRAWEYNSRIEGGGMLEAWPQLLTGLIEIFKKVFPGNPQFEGGHTVRENDYLSRALHYIHSRYREPIRVKDMAAAGRLSVSHFGHLFKRYMQVAPVEYRNRLRIANALEQIRTTDASISEIAFESGFESISQFNESFKRETGQSPSYYRKSRNPAF